MTQHGMLILLFGVVFCATAVEPLILANRKINESSGVVASRQTPGLFWTHNDSGDSAQLFGFDTQGAAVSHLRLEVKKPRDCEDACAFSREGDHFLVLADVGDNARRRKDCRLLIFKEPAKSVTRLAKTSIRQLRFRYSDGARDCESVAVDASRNEVILLEKVRNGMARISTLSLEPSELEIVETKPAGEVGVTLATGMDISDDGNRLLVVTYGHGREWTRKAGESWPEVLANTPGRKILLPPRPQGEAGCYTLDGKSIIVTSERLPAFLYQIPVFGIEADAGSTQK